MIIDTSAVLAILLAEDDADRYVIVEFLLSHKEFLYLFTKIQGATEF